METVIIHVEFPPSPRFSHLLGSFDWNPHQVAQEQKEQSQTTQEGEVGIQFPTCWARAQTWFGIAIHKWENIPVLEIHSLNHKTAYTVHTLNIYPPQAYITEHCHKEFLRVREGTVEQGVSRAPPHLLAQKTPPSSWSFRSAILFSYSFSSLMKLMKFSVVPCIIHMLPGSLFTVWELGFGLTRSVPWKSARLPGVFACTLDHIGPQIQLSYTVCLPGTPGWLSRLSNRPQLRSWSEGSEIKLHILLLAPRHGEPDSPTPSACSSPDCVLSVK